MRTQGFCSARICSAIFRRPVPVLIAELASIAVSMFLRGHIR